MRWKWWILFTWVAVSLVMVFTMPDLGQLVREKGQPSIPDHYSSQVANILAERLDEEADGEGRMTVLAVFGGKENALSQRQQNEVEGMIRSLEKRKEELGITQVLHPFEEETLKERLLSKNGSTVLIPISVERKGRTVEEVREELDAALSTSVPHLLTGPQLIDEDFARTSLEGIRKTESISVLFILAVLVIVFRSPVAPLVSLVSVAFSYAVSLGIVAHLVESWDFPFANFTQVFLVLVLFGVGTDYNILLFSRFKEELSKGKSVAESIVVTYRTAGKTVFYSGLTVFIGFACLGLARFSIYQAGVAVAIGVLVMLAALTTVIPFFMSLLGHRLFWPAQTNRGYGENRMWSSLSSFSYRRPLFSLLLVGLLTVPVLFLHEDTLSYNSLDEVDDSYPSVRGFETVSDTFTPGRTMPVQIMLHSSHPLDSAEALGLLDRVANTLDRVNGVRQVYGPTRPQGEPLEDFYVSEQTGEVGEGIGEAGSGTEAVREGLDQAVAGIGSGSDTDFSQVDRLLSGTAATREGVGRANEALAAVQAGLNRGADGVGEIRDGLHSLEQSAGRLASSTQELAAGYNQLYKGYQTFGRQYRQVEEQIGGVAAALQLVQGQAEKLVVQRPDLAADPDYVTLKRTVDELVPQVDRLRGGFSQLNDHYEGTLASFSQTNDGLKQVQTGQKKMGAGIGELRQGTEALASGLERGASGQAQVREGLKSVETGLGRVYEGQRELLSGLQQLDGNLSELKGGLNESADGLGEISDGLEGARSYLEELSGGISDAFYVPEEVRKSSDFQAFLDRFLSRDRNTVQWEVELADDPYSQEAMEVVADLEEAVASSIRGTPLEGAELGIGGVSSQNRDLSQLSTDDLYRTAGWMLAGIALVLLWLLRSFWNTVYALAALILSYFTALTATEVIFIHILDQPGLTWTVPFFSLIMIVSLGVDYTIFLMMRYREHPEMYQGDAIVLAAKRVGGVVISAAIILSGTFAALYPSGVLTLVQIATVVIIALMLLAVVLLPMFMPAMMAVTERLRTPRESWSVEK